MPMYSDDAPGCDYRGDVAEKKSREFFNTGLGPKWAAFLSVFWAFFAAVQLARILQEEDDSTSTLTVVVLVGALALVAAHGWTAWRGSRRSP